MNIFYRIRTMYRQAQGLDIKTEDIKARSLSKVCSLYFAEEDYFYQSKDSKKRKILKKLQYLQIHEVMNGLHSEHVHPLIRTLKLQCHLNIPCISRYSI
ncbi:hypothetical protein NQ318_017674 [Aromia moschata]|uniref:Uncharacterized protein n=1 Tax=Aromia moschata TaxID=1265417 RepID=A0AAV8XGC2_9CUCU|nr:hypothetical protein NQ318_017674 [Aromia moschata]